jgi:tRNA threonylcarbamoyladenosine biosynthesis protein TsaB
VIVLGFDTATPVTAVGLLVEGSAPLEARDEPLPGERPGHGTRLLALADDLLRTAGVDWSDLGRIGVGTGPGTFTGLRIGVSTARALAQATGAELVAVPTPLALAAGVAAEFPGPQRVLAVIDARRGEAFVAAYRVAGGDGRGAIAGPRGAERGPNGVDMAAVVEQLAAPQALVPERLAELAVREEGPAWLAVGDGAIRFRDHLERAQVAVPPEASPLHRVSGGVVCRLAATGPPVSISGLTPQYLRAPDADLPVRPAPQ